MIPLPYVTLSPVPSTTITPVPWDTLTPVPWDTLMPTRRPLPAAENRALQAEVAQQQEQLKDLQSSR